MKRITLIACTALLTVACSKAPDGGALPAECNAYVATVNACVEKVGGNNPGVTMFKQQMENAKAEWAKIPDKRTLAPTCKQMEDAFKQSAATALKC